MIMIVQRLLLFSFHLLCLAVGKITFSRLKHNVNREAHCLLRCKMYRNIGMYVCTYNSSYPSVRTTCIYYIHQAVKELMCRGYRAYWSLRVSADSGKQTVYQSLPGLHWTAQQHRFKCVNILRLSQLKHAVRFSTFEMFTLRENGCYIAPVCIHDMYTDDVVSYLSPDRYKKTNGALKVPNYNNKPSPWRQKEMCNVYNPSAAIVNDYCRLYPMTKLSAWHQLVSKTLVCSREKHFREKNFPNNIKP